MYTRAKEIGRKVMAGGENRMMQPARGPMWSSKSKNQASPNERLGFDRRSNKKGGSRNGLPLALYVLRRCQLTDWPTQSLVVEQRKAQWTQGTAPGTMARRCPKSRRYL